MKTVDDIIQKVKFGGVICTEEARLLIQEIEELRLRLDDCYDPAKRLRNLLAEKEEIQAEINSLAHHYTEKPRDSYLYISDHAIIRYAQRVKGWTDVKEISQLPIPPQKLRKEMLTADEQKEIVRKNIRFYNKNGIIFLINCLTVVTVYREGERE